MSRTLYICTGVFFSTHICIFKYLRHKASVWVTCEKSSRSHELYTYVQVFFFNLHIYVYLCVYVRRRVYESHVKSRLDVHHWIKDFDTLIHHDLIETYWVRGIWMTWSWRLFTYEESSWCRWLLIRDVDTLINHDLIVTDWVRGYLDDLVETTLHIWRVVLMSMTDKRLWYTH